MRCKALTWAIGLLSAALVPALAQQAVQPGVSVQGPALKPPERISYATVGAALEALRKKPGVAIATRDGWTMIDDRAATTTWSFTPANHPAHPAVVKRAIVQQGGQIYLDSALLCEGPKPACDQLHAEVGELDKKAGEAISKGLKK